MSEISPDYYKMLGLPRRASLAADEIRQAFQKAAAQSHPDGAPDEPARVERTARFQVLNEAQACLTNGASRLRHLLALEFPDFAAPRGVAMDQGMVDLFTGTGAAVQAAESWSKKRQAAGSFLAKAALAGEEMEVQEGLESAGAALNLALDQLEADLVEWDKARGESKNKEPEIDGALESPAGTLHACSQRAAFLEKWKARLQSAWTLVFSAG